MLSSISMPSSLFEETESSLRSTTVSLHLSKLGGDGVLLRLAVELKVKPESMLLHDSEYIPKNEER